MSPRLLRVRTHRPAHDQTKRYVEFLVHLEQRIGLGAKDGKMSKKKKKDQEIVTKVGVIESRAARQYSRVK